MPAVRIAEWFGPPGTLAARARRSNLLEQSTRSAAIYHQYLRQLAPDIVVLTPMIVLKTAQLDLARAALELGIRNVFAVASWDHLSSKGDLTFQPQRVIVWNDLQKREAVELLQLDANRVITTGSQIFDEWFVKTPSSSRDEFCARVGLRPDRPIVLYVCSSLLEGSTPEPPFVVRWAKHLRQSGHQSLRDCGILVRPHHEHGEAWRKVNVKGMDNAGVLAEGGGLPGRRAVEDRLLRFALPRGRGRRAQHQRHDRRRPFWGIPFTQSCCRNSRPARKGPFISITSSRSPGDCFTRRDRSTTTQASSPRLWKAATPIPNAARDSFVQFVRPRGLTTPATEVFVQELESLAAQPTPEPMPIPVWAPLIRPILQPFANAAAERMRRMEEESRRRSVQRLEEHRQRKAPQLEAHRQQRIAQHRRRKRDAANAASGVPDAS